MEPSKPDIFVNHGRCTCGGPGCQYCVDLYAALLEALRAVNSLLDRPEDMYGEEGEPTEELNSAIDAARAALALAEGKKR